MELLGRYSPNLLWNTLEEELSGFRLVPFGILILPWGEWSESLGILCEIYIKYQRRHQKLIECLVSEVGDGFQIKELECVVVFFFISGVL